MSYASVASAVVGTLGVAVGAVNEGKANNRIKDAMSKRKAFQTPDEVFQILNATENKSQGDTVTRDFNTNQIDQSFGNALGISETLGGDPNSLSALFGQKIQGILQVGDQFHKSNMESFGNYMNALKLMSDNKAAEQISQDNMLKDVLQSASKQKSDANSTINSGMNAILSGISAYGTEQLYKDSKDKTPGAKADASASFGTGSLGREYTS